MSKITWGFDRFGNWTARLDKGAVVPNVLVCCICDCCDDPESMRTTAGGRGPICQDCWADLIDPDHALLLDKRLETAEAKIDELQEEIRRLTT